MKNVTKDYRNNPEVEWLLGRVNKHHLCLEIRNFSARVYHVLTI